MRHILNASYLTECHLILTSGKRPSSSCLLSVCWSVQVLITVVLTLLLNDLILFEIFAAQVLLTAEAFANLTC